MSHFSLISSWELPHRAFVLSLEEMARDGVHGNEGVAFWLGTHHGEQARISLVVAARGPDVIKGPELLVIGAETMNSLTDICIERRLVLVGQIHSHGDTWVDLSHTDRRDGFKSHSYLSAVAPCYARRKDTKVSMCGFHVCAANSVFHRLTPPEITTRISMPADVSVDFKVVGE